MVDLYNAYCVDDAAGGKGRVADLVTVYVEEAHPADGWALPFATIPITHRQPRSTAERLEVARAFVARFTFPLPLWVDTLANEVGYAYDAWPERLYIVVDGVVVYKSAPGVYSGAVFLRRCGSNNFHHPITHSPNAGPFGYNLADVETWLVERYGKREPRERSRLVDTVAADAASCRR